MMLLLQRFQMLVKLLNFQQQRVHQRRWLLQQWNQRCQLIGIVSRQTVLLYQPLRRYRLLCFFPRQIRYHLQQLLGHRTSLRMLALCRFRLQ